MFIYIFHLIWFTNVTIWRKKTAKRIRKLKGPIDSKTHLWAKSCRNIQKNILKHSFRQRPLVLSFRSVHWKFSGNSWRFYANDMLSLQFTLQVHYNTIKPITGSYFSFRMISYDTVMSLSRMRPEYIGHTVSMEKQIILCNHCYYFKGMLTINQ